MFWVAPVDLQTVFMQLQSTDAEPPPILPTSWLESQASFLMELMLRECKTQYELGKLLQLLADTGTTLLQGKTSVCFGYGILLSTSGVPLEIWKSLSLCFSSMQGQT